MRIGPPNALDWPKPMSSISTMSTLGAPAGAFTWNLGGGVALRASTSVIVGLTGSGIGSAVRSVGTTTRGAVDICAPTGGAVIGASARARLTATICLRLIGALHLLKFVQQSVGGNASA